jgi:hypothetical protein
MIQGVDGLIPSGSTNLRDPPEEAGATIDSIELKPLLVQTVADRLIDAVVLVVRITVSNVVKVVK